jgi:hypothetical protein
MSHLIEVAFKGNRKEFYLWDGDDPPRVSAPVIVEGDRGEDLGHVHAVEEAAAQRFAGVAHGAALGAGVHPVPEAVDREVARLKLESLGVEIDELTPEQRDYLRSWS